MKQRSEEYAFVESLYYQYRSMMLKLVYKYVSDPNAREDVFQEAFVRILKSVKTLRGLPQQKLEAYIVMIIRYAAVDYYRKMHYDKNVDIADDVLTNMLGHKSKESAPGINDFGRVELTMMMKQLPEEDRILIVGRHYWGLSINELCEIFGGSPSKIRTQLFRVKERILKEWLKSGLKMEDFLNE